MVYYKIQLDIRVKSYRFFNLLGSIVFDFVCLDIYDTQSDIRVKSYCRLNLLGYSVFNFERLDILRDSIGYPSKKLLSFEFAWIFHFYIQPSQYYETQSDNRETRYCC